MLRIAKQLDSLVDSLQDLSRIATLAQGLTNADLQKLFEASAESKIQARAKFIDGKNASIEYFRALVSAAVQELSYIADLTDLDVEPTALEDSEPIVDPVVDPVVDPALPVDPTAPVAPVTPVAPADPTETEVSLGDGVEVIYNDEKELFLKLPDNSVLRVSEASRRDQAVLKARKPSDKKFSVGSCQIKVAVEDGTVLYESDKELFVKDAKDGSILKMVEASDKDKAKLNLNVTK